MNRQTIKRAISKGSIAATLCFSTLALTSCPKDEYGLYQRPMPEYIKAYHNKDAKENANPNRMSAYFDLSDGIWKAYEGNKGAEKFLKAMAQSYFSDKSFDIYSIADSKITPLNYAGNDLFNYVTDKQSYDKIMAPIKKTLTQIVKDNKSALLVTDFEEYTEDRKVQYHAFANPFFTQWLEAGNDVTFYIFDYDEDGTAKHLFFIVFDHKDHKMLNDVNEALKMYNVSGFKKYHLSCDAYNIGSKYESAIKGGTYHLRTGEDIVTAVPQNGGPEDYTNFGNGSCVEYYPLGDSWANIQKNAKATAVVGNDPMFSALFRNVFADFSDNDSYIIKSLKATVTNVQNDLVKYSATSDAKNDPDKQLPIYDESNGKLLAAYDYSKGAGKTNEVMGLLELDQKIYELTKKNSNDKECEIALNFSKNFEGKIVGGENNDTYRVDIYVDQCEQNYKKLDELFSWTNFEGKENSNLSDAIRTTLKDAMPLVKKKVVYTYYLKCLE